MRSYHNYCLIKKNRRPRVLKNSIGAIAKPGHTLFQQGGRELLVPKGTWQRHSFIAQESQRRYSTTITSYYKDMLFSRGKGCSLAGKHDRTKEFGFPVLPISFTKS